MFQRIYTRKRKTLWSYGPVAAYYVPLAYVDSMDENAQSSSVLETGERRSAARLSWRAVLASRRGETFREMWAARSRPDLW